MCVYFLQESHESITYRMLDRVKAIELIPSSLEKVIVPYMKEHNLQKDKMLFQYIGVSNLRNRFGISIIITFSAILGSITYHSPSSIL